MASRHRLRRVKVTAVPGGTSLGSSKRERLFRKEEPFSFLEAAA